MNRLVVFSIVTLVFLFYSCKNTSRKSYFVEWEKFQEAVDEKNIDYLLNISTDSLQCVECDNGNSWVSKKAFFEKYFSQIAIVKNDKDYTVVDLDMEHISHKFSKKETEGFFRLKRVVYDHENNGNKYSLFYDFIVGKDSVKFIGVFSIP